jgi:hypothetical protein
MSKGVLLTADGQMLFTKAPPADPNCRSPCSASFRPFIAAPGATAGGLWTLAPAADGATPQGDMQWAYDGAPLYVWPTVNERQFYVVRNLDRFYGYARTQVKDPVAEGLAVKLDDPLVASKPVLERKVLVNWGVWNDTDDDGDATVSLCVDRFGGNGPVTLTQSSGSKRLDELTLEFGHKIPLTPAKSRDGKPVTVCGFEMQIRWRGRGSNYNNVVVKS